ncbi:MAG: hypothetical protein QOF33_1165 [Thermomicrobiales bacterium]|nr:hypothetical protein [Thermomicrobiales bacterium]
MLIDELRRRPRLTRTPGPRSFATAALIGALAVWMGLVSLAAPHPNSDRVPANGLSSALLQDACQTAAQVGDNGLNWGAVASPVADPGCQPGADPEQEQFANWGQVPPSAIVIRITLNGQVELPEAVGQPAGDVGGGACVPTTTSPDPKWTDVNRWDPNVLSATQQVYQETGVLVPTNVVKAIMMIESGGNPNEGPAYGLMQVTAGAMDSYDLNRARTEPAYGIYAGTRELALRYIDSKKRPWENVIVGYFSGHYDPTGAKDEFSSDFQYQERFKQLLAELEAVAPSDRPCTATSAVGLASIWGNKLFNGAPPPTSQGYGPTDFSVYVHPEWYSYALDYGFASPGHTGLDIAIPAGTPLYAPMDGTVVCAGTGNGNGDDSCAAFLSSYGGPTSGRLQLKLPNGEMLILGHVNQSLVRPNDQVKAGQEIGISGSMNGDHVHIEYRVRDTTTPSGWKLVDPHVPLDGVQVTVTPGSGGMTQPPAATVTPTMTPSATETTPASPEASPSASATSDTDTGSLSASPSVTLDTDGDGLTDDEEDAVGTDPTKPDTDGDGLPDANEVKQHGTDPKNPDTDNDGHNDHDEVNADTDPKDPASVPGGVSASPVAIAAPDRDGDGLPDDQEVVHGSNPDNPDSDGDGLLDGDEVALYGSSPTNGDTDGDGYLDGEEVSAGSKPNDPASFPDNGSDTDGDGLTDSQEAELGTDPNNSDSDFDGYTDSEEAGAGANPNDPASFPGNTAVDSDSDGLSDDDEAGRGTDPNNPDSDGDGLSDGQEVQGFLTNPLEVDSDFDGADDASEVSAGTDPNDSSSVPF